MAEISATIVKELREKSGAGMMECKKALQETNGDMAKAMDYMREKGIAGAAKKAGRSAKEGLIGLAVSADGKKGVLVEVSCETDFVARTDDFKGMVAGLATEALKESFKDDPAQAAAQMLKRPSSKLAGKTVEEEIKALIAKLGENMALSRVAALDAGANGIVGSYMHPDGKLATLVALQASKPASLSAEAAPQLAKDLAMQVAGANPPALVVSREQVPADFIAKEREIALAQAKATGKPENILPKIAEGKVNKVLQEITLLEQAFVKEPELLIRDLVKREGGKAGDTFGVAGFKRLRVGEKDKESDKES